MEADWSVEIGAGLPVIEVDWAEFVDLRAEPGRVSEIREAAAEPALREALALLNGPGSAVFTSKCAVWELAAAEIDPLEFDCQAEEARAGLASWIDVLARDAKAAASFEKHQMWVRLIVERLRTETVGAGRVDLVVRAAVTKERDAFGITLYAVGCGVDVQAAHAAWDRVLGAAVTATMTEGWASSSIG